VLDADGDKWGGNLVSGRLKYRYGILKKRNKTGRVRARGRQRADLTAQGGKKTNESGVESAHKTNGVFRRYVPTKTIFATVAKFKDAGGGSSKKKGDDGKGTWEGQSLGGSGATSGFVSKPKKKEKTFAPTV